MKRMLSVLFLSVFLFNVCGYYLFFTLSRNEIRNEAKQGRTEVFEISKTDRSLTWTENDEIEYKGKRYDVVKKEEKNGMFILLCINDTKEENLWASFSNHIDDFVAGNSTNKKDSKDFSKKVNLLYAQDIAPVLPVNYFQSTDRFYKEEQDLLSFPRTVPVPPPDLV